MKITSLAVCFTLILGICSQFRASAQINNLPTEIIDTQKNEDALLDSIATLLFDNSSAHTLMARVGFTDKALFAGRSYGQNQSLLVPSLTYMHKSGFYGELAGFSYSQSQPRYQLTMASVGYVGTISSKFTYLGEYSKSFYTKTDSFASLSNSLTVYGSYRLGKYDLSLNYSFLFGNGSYSHLLVPSISRTFVTKKPWKFVDQLRFTPSVSATFGNYNSFSNYGSGNPFLNGDTTGLTIGGNPRWASSSSPGTRPSWLGSGPPSWVTNGGTTQSANQTQFGAMAYTLSLPVSVKIRDFNVNFTTNLTKPVALSASEGYLHPTVNFNLGLAYTFKW